ncbi:ATP-dependent DNA helicase [Gonapodya prolifera JEL478]|uniref:ATP-dependent DNA helicase n=1 Tax=Gonapodya prolifera (strain JEL478) TaxID=1344416 RepID=A0A139A9V8_GONPJ|nr:ATP-dependent DNA helicase [Gonapodya prolifera JEL478]|eukprot:KXS13275.1 ATP-dependent DNA helicase [Gonapodya prolifera JEL478]
MSTFVVLDSDEEPSSPAVPLPPRSEEPSRGTGATDAHPHQNSSSRSRGPGTEGFALIRAQIADCDAELENIRKELEFLIERRTQLETLRANLTSSLPSTTASSSVSRPAAPAVDFSTPSFPWHARLLTLRRRFWPEITQFRNKQLDVINATCAGKDVVYVAQTGGGKSLTYQLPAIHSPGITLVVSPLVSLSRDQLLSLRHRRIGAAALYAGTSRDEEKRVAEDMVNGAGGPWWDHDDGDGGGGSGGGGGGSGGGRGGGGGTKNVDEDQDEHGYDGGLRLVYVTPEKVAKSKRFIQTLEKCHKRGRLARIVVDEAHCCSTQGHDFRPDYAHLGLLRQLFPTVPVLALSATLPPSLLASVVQVLGLVPGEADPEAGVLVVQSELYRANLRFEVIPKARGAKEEVKQIGDWIHEKHPGHSGIVYCLSRKDTETYSAGLREQGISSLAYHADLSDDTREAVHVRWRDGNTDVVCATIAFGLGIDKPDVRFVAHATMSKSCEGYYQEAGRAGRDGEPADCVLFYRAGDVSRLSSMVFNDHSGLKSLYLMVRYCEDLSMCRRELIRRHFGAGSTTLSGTNARLVSAEEGRCGNCDHCLDDGTPIEVERVDVTREAVEICKVLIALKDGGGEVSESAKGKGTADPDRVTIVKLIELLRGVGPLAKLAEIQVLVRDGLVSFPIGARYKWGRDDVEKLIIAMILDGRIREEFAVTAYTTNAYVTCSRAGRRLAEMWASHGAERTPKIELVMRKSGVTVQKDSKRQRSAANGVKRDRNDEEDSEHLEEDFVQLRKLKTIKT